MFRFCFSVFLYTIVTCNVFQLLTHYCESNITTRERTNSSGSSIKLVNAQCDKICIYAHWYILRNTNLKYSTLHSFPTHLIIAM